MKLPTLHTSQTAPKSPRKSAYLKDPPRGLWYEHRPMRINEPFVARWRLPGGKKDSQSFANEEARAVFAETWLMRKKQYGVEAAIASPKDVEIWREFERMTGGAHPLDVARFWLRMRGMVDGKLTVEKAVEKYAESQKDRKLAPDSIRHRDLHLARFVESFGSKRLYDVTPEKISAWLNGLKKTDGEPMSAASKKHHRMTLQLLFTHAARASWVDRNPVDAVPVPEGEVSDDVNILSIEQARALFSANRDALCIGRLALEAFGGLRYSSAARIVRGDLDFDAKGIVFPGPKHKSGRRHYVDGFPDNLWAWLNHAHAACWDINQRMYLEMKRAAFVAAGLKGEGADDEEMRNVLRHSFATYHVAMNKNAAATAVLLTHRNPTMLYQHYKGRASAAAAEEYFKIMP